MSAPNISQDHYLLAWAFACGGAEWQPWAPSWFGRARYREPYGQFQFDGTVFVTRLSNMGVPVMRTEMRERILERLAEWRMLEG